MYKATPFSRSLVGFLASASMVLASFAPIAAPLAYAAGYAISGSSTVNGLQVTVSGQASANPYTGQGNDQHVSIDWNEDNSASPSNSNGAWQTVLNINASGGSFASTSWTGTHTYPAPGPYKIFVRVHHAQAGGAESGSGTINFSVVINYQCSDGVDNDGDTFVDFPADPGCTSATDNTESPNPPTTATLTLQKTVVNDNGGSAADTAWTLSATGPTNISGTEGQSAITGATVTQGAYTLGETGGPSGYTASQYSCVKNNAAPVVSNSITLAATDVAVCTITNNDIAPTLTLNKTVVNNGGGTAEAASFQGKVDGMNVAWGVATTVSAGTRTASETNLSGYSASVWGGDCTDNGSITLAPGENKVCSITNDDIAPTLMLVKTVVNNDGGTATAANFQGKIDGSDVSWSVAVPVTPGAHTASEATLPGYAASAWGGDCATDGSVTLALGDSKTCTITNNDIAPTIMVTKSVTNDNGGQATVNSFSFLLDGITSLIHNTAVTAAIGSHTVSEGAFAGYTASTWAGDCATDGSVTLSLGQTANCTITNDDVAPTLTLIKHLPNNDGGEATEEDFQAKIDGNDVAWNTPITLSAGSHTASESGDMTGYSASDWSGSCSTDGDITLVPGQNATCEITNDDVAPGLTLHKIVTNDNGGNAQTSDFQAMLNESPVAWDSAQTLTAGTYGLSETSLPGYIASAWSCDGGSLDGNNITIEVGETVECTITNDDTASSITLTKVVTNDNGGTAEVGDFTFMIGETEATSGEVVEVVSNTEVSINELGLEGYSFVSITGEGCPSKLGDTVELSEGQNLECTITNDDDAPSLTLVKEVNNGDEQGDAEPSNWTLTATGPTTFSGKGTAESDAEFDAGSYTLSEDEGPGHYAAGAWSCVVNEEEPTEGSTVELGLGDTAICTIVNTFTPFSSDISVDKSIDNATPLNGAQVVYTITASNAGPDDATGVQVNDLLPSGATYVSDDGEGDYISSTGVWTIGSLANGASAVLHITATASGESQAVVSNSASVTSSYADPDSEDNSDSVSFTVADPAGDSQCSDNADNDGDSLADEADPNCHSDGDAGNQSSYDPNDNNEDEDSRSNGGGSRRSTPSSGGEVLGAETGPAPECSEYLLGYIKQGERNDAGEVAKLETFLNQFEGNALPVDGAYGPADAAAVHAFQTKYASEVLTPWALKGSTGWVYYTTRKQVNTIFCKFQMEFPLTQAQLSDIAYIKARQGTFAQNQGNTAGAGPSTPAKATSPAVGTVVLPNGTIDQNAGAKGEPQTAAAANASSEQGWFTKFINWLFGK